MNENKTPENIETDETEGSPRSTDRKAKREARRVTTRSGLRRKPTATPTKDESGTPDDEKKPATAKAKVRRKPAKKKTTALKTAKKKTVARKPAPKPEEDEYELRNQPDGTLLRVKVSKTKKKIIPVRRRSRDDADSGPGPAIMDADLTGVTLGRKKEAIFGPREGKIKRSIGYLNRKIVTKPKVAVILGSGLFPAAEFFGDKKTKFTDIPEFPLPMAEGHPGYFVTGSHDGVPLLFSAGRSHYYETGSMSETTHAIQAILALGVEHLIITTSAGAINPDFRKGDIMLVEDHINLMGDNPLFGVDPNSDPSVFVNCNSIYDDSLADKYDRLCRSARVRPKRGTLVAVRGPVYETPAERKFLGTIGADAVCMSMVPEALVAARMGVPTTGLAIISNEASPKLEKAIAHNDVVSAGKRNSERLKRVLAKLIPQAI
ncbi:Purine nucleoside phosphorylase [hydrothermal vent metagenome]|uniref:purine-nucleoside phosphorylase n=1 Tax=hydrothermal vent metagenome TaxID=652676 RepID=A0A3B1BN53_9ZZZZ